jgi:rhodanese-related sulfurtransferase
MDWKTLAVGVALAVGFWVYAGGLGRTSPAEAREKVKQGALLLDVRTAEEFAGGHIEGAINIPVQNLEARLSEVPKERALVVYCRSGGRSARAMRMLKEKGYTVFDLGGMGNWTP